jgi:hypothetical protein
LLGRMARAAVGAWTGRSVGLEGAGDLAGMPRGWGANALSPGYRA